MQDIKFKSNSGQFNIDQAQGIVECFVAGIGNKDSVGDIVVSGAFAKSLIRRKPRVVWGHNWNDPIGKVLEIYEVPPNDPRLPGKMKTAGIGGLYAKVQFNLNSEKGREAFANVAFFGEEQEWSIGYKTLDAIYDNGRQANILREVELYELSPVLHGANQLTGTISVKSDEEKMHMSVMGGPAVAVVEKPQGPVDPFAQGVAQPAGSDRTAALERELASRTGGPVKVMKATESSVVFMKPGKGVFRLGYYFDGEQYMFGKPEKMGATMMVVSPGAGRPTPGPNMPRIPNFPGVQGKPSAPEPIIPVKYGNDAAASGFFDLDDEKSLSEQLAEQPDFVEQLSGIVGSLQNLINQHRSEKSELIIPCRPEQAFETKQALDPVFDYHRIETYVTEDGIVIASPLNGDAYEAVENATKSLLGRIGRGIGGGGKVRRGRTALARIQGILDPRKRRDFDNDGLIFDGTWMEQPDPTRFVSRTMDTLRSSGRKPNEVSLALTGNEVPRLDISFTRTEKTKILEVLDNVISENQLSEDNPITKFRDSIKSARKVGEQIQPQLFGPEGEALLNSVKAEFEKLQPSFEKHGGKKPGTKGRAPSDIIKEVLEQKRYTRKNIDKRAKGGVGGVSARTGTAVGMRTNIVGSNKPLPKLRGRKDKKLNVDDFIENEFLPADWYDMSGDEKLRWLNSRPEGAGNEGTNEDALLNLRPGQFAWQKTIREITNEALEQSMEEEDPEEARRERRRDAAIRRAERADAPRLVEEQRTKKQQKEEQQRAARRAAAVAQREKGDGTRAPRNFKPDEDRPDTRAHVAQAKKRTSEMDKVRTYVNSQSKKGKINKNFEDAVREGLDDVDLLIADEDDVPTLESIRDARDRIEALIETLTDPKTSVKKVKKQRKNPDTGEMENYVEEESVLSFSENETINGLKTISGKMTEHIVNMEDREDELDPERDVLSASGERSFGAENIMYDTDEYGGGIDRNFNRTLRSSGSASRVRNLNSIVDEARQFQTTLARRKANGSLRSSGGSKDKTPRTEIIKESTWWKQIDSSLRREIDKADSSAIKDGLTILQQKISKYKAGSFTPGSKRTNVGSIKVTADEADKILDAVMAVIDRQMSAGKGGSVGSRAEIFAELLEAVSSAAMSTFIDKTGKPAD